MIEALRSLQSKIARLETERAAAAEKFESLSSRTNQKQRDLSDNPILPDSTPEAPRLENMSFSELRAISTRDTRPHQVSTVDAGYKNTVGSREECSYNRYVLIKGKINRGTYRNVSSENVLITGIFLYPVFL